MDRVLASRGRRFRHHHAAAHTDRGENHDPIGTLITAQELNGGLGRPTRNKRTVPPGVRPYRVTPARAGLNASTPRIRATKCQPRQTVAAEKTGRPGDQDAGHRTKSGQDASRSAIVVGANGHSIPKAGSFQRTPAAASGWNTSPII